MHSAARTRLTCAGHQTARGLACSLRKASCTRSRELKSHRQCKYVELLQYIVNRTEFPSGCFS